MLNKKPNAANIMQYLIQMSDEFKESYQKIDKQINNIQDKIDLLVFKTEELETRINVNRNDNEK